VHGVFTEVGRYFFHTIWSNDMMLAVDLHPVTFPSLFSAKCQRLDQQPCISNRVHIHFGFRDVASRGFFFARYVRVSKDIAARPKLKERTRNIKKLPSKKKIFHHGRLSQSNALGVHRRIQKKKNPSVQLICPALVRFFSPERKALRWRQAHSSRRGCESHKHTQTLGCV
jgi:hypothetical protein